MSEFKERLRLQREILKRVNSKFEFSLNGISASAIGQWRMRNGIDTESDLVKKISDVSKDLMFLANRSHESVFSQYKSKVEVIEKKINNI